MKIISVLQKRSTALITALLIGITVFTCFALPVNSASVSGEATIQSLETGGSGSESTVKSVKKVQITGQSVNIRKGAGTSYSKLATVNKGTKYDYIGQKKDSSGRIWYQIKLNSKTKGWVTSKYSKIITVRITVTVTSASTATTTASTEPLQPSSSTQEPTTQPSQEPTTQPSQEPTTQPSQEPTTQPSQESTTQPSQSSTSSTTKTTTAKKNQSVVNSVAKKYGAVGVQVAVIKNGVVTDTYEYGYATKKSDPMTSNHKIRVASLSKVVVGMNAMKMQEEQIINLDKNIGSYWGAKPYKKTTLRQLLSHRSYLRDNSYVASKAGALKQLKSSSSYKSSSGWVYNNYGVGIAGSTLEVASGRALNSYANEKFFTPLGIDAAFSSGNLKNKKLIATLYYPNDSVAKSKASAQKITQRAPGGNTAHFAGGLTISAKDLAKLTAILANDGVYNGRRYLSADSVKMMETAQCSAYSRGHSFKQCIPLRYQTDIYGQKKMYYHLGVAYGTLAYLGYNPDTRNGMVIITTGASQSYDDRGIWRVCSEIAQYLYNH